MYKRQVWGVIEDGVGSQFFNFEKNEEAIESFLNSESMLLELNWEGQGDVYFNYDLRGANEFVANAREQCSQL